MSEQCFWHGDEPIPEGAFRVCFECGHAWPTQEDFVVDAQRIGPTVTVDLAFCPLCAHDF